MKKCKHRASESNGESEMSGGKGGGAEGKPQHGRDSHPARWHRSYQVAISIFDSSFRRLNGDNIRWATHGAPSDLNCHPHRSGDGNEFVVVHNGIITNYKVLTPAHMACD